MSDRSGVAPVELAVLEVLDAAVSGRPRAHARSATALAGIEERLGLGPRYAYDLLLDLARPWVIPVRTVTMQGNVGDRSFPDAAGPGYTECRPSHVGQLVLAAEAHQLAPVPVGRINGTSYRGGTQPPLEPRRVLAALRRLLDDPQVRDQEVISIVGPPYSVTGCTITGDLRALARGRRVFLRETGQITITGIPVPEAPQDPPPPAHGIKVMGLGERVDRFTFPAHLIIEALPARTVAAEVAQAIARRSASRPWSEDHPELARRAILPVVCVDDQSGHEVRIPVTLRPGSDPMAVRDQIASIEGVSAEASCTYPAPLASLLRSWVTRHGSEDIASSLTELGKAIDRDQRRERRNH